MGKRGPAQMPRQLRLVSGSHLERLNENEPIPRSGELECPAGVDAEVRLVWDEVVAELEHMKVDAPADRYSLLCYCEAVIGHRKASAVLSKSPILIQGVHGNLVRNPALQVQRDYAATIRAFAQEFGLTPSARTSIATGDLSDHDNPFAGSGSG